MTYSQDRQADAYEMILGGSLPRRDHRRERFNHAFHRVHELLKSWDDIVLGERTPVEYDPLLIYDESGTPIGRVVPKKAKAEPVKNPAYDPSQPEYMWR